MIKRIEINGYKSLREANISLTPLVIIFGPNSSGKSNFLDAMQLLSQLATMRTLKDAFKAPYRGRPIESFSFPEKGIEDLLKKDSISFSYKIDVELSEEIIKEVNREINEMRHGIEAKNNKGNYVKEKLLRYELEIELIPEFGLLRVKNERLVALKDINQEKKKPAPFIEKVENKLILRMEGQAHPRYFDIGLDHTILSQSLYVPHYPHISALKKEFSSWKFFYFEPRERMRLPNPTKETNNIGMMGEELAAYLNTLKGKKPDLFKAINAAIKQIIPSINSIDTEINYKTGEVELLIYENNTPIPARLISEGTLRLIGLFSISSGDVKPSVICFEEPENGIHPRRIKQIAEYLKNIADTNCQVIATTHSPLLPNYIDNEYLYVCKKSSGTTVISSFKESGIFKENAINAMLDEGYQPSDFILNGQLDI